MRPEISEMQSFTVEEFQANFDNLLDRVEAGESFLITSEHGNAVIVPYSGNENVDDLVKIYTEHNEAP
jgi:prevent-host-death family protein